MGNHGTIEQDTSISREDLGISGDAVRLAAPPFSLRVADSLLRQVNISTAAYKFSSDICKKVSGGLWDFNCMVHLRKQKVRPPFCGAASDQF